MMITTTKSSGVYETTIMITHYPLDRGKHFDTGILDQPRDLVLQVKLGTRLHTESTRLLTQNPHPSSSDTFE